MKKFALPKMAISLPLAVLAAAILIFISEVSFRESSSVVASIEEAQKTRNALNKLLQLVLNAETGQRGYLLTGDTRYLEPYSAATSDVDRQLDELHKLFMPYTEQMPEFGLLSQQISSKLAEMELTVRMRKDGNDEAWKSVLATNVGQNYMEAIRQQVGKLSAARGEKIAAGQLQTRRTLELARLGITVMALAGLLAFYLYLYQMQTLFESGMREKESLKRERDQLDLQVRERTANLAELATHLQNVREDERAHLARELHDELGALLTAAKLDVARIKSRMGNSIPEAAERLVHLTSTLNSGIALKRRIIEDLRPSSLSHLGLVASLEILARESEERTSLSIITNLEPVNLSDAIQLTVYRVVQESLTNIAKYANATQAVVSLRNMDCFVAVEVHDNGNGFDLATVGSASHGLSGMRHRVEAAGGQLTVTTASGTGTHISAVMPQVA